VVLKQKGTEEKKSQAVGRGKKEAQDRAANGQPAFEGKSRRRDTMLGLADQRSPTEEKGTNCRKAA